MYTKCIPCETEAVHIKHTFCWQYVHANNIDVSSKVNIMDSIVIVSIKHKFMLEILMSGDIFLDAFCSFLDFKSSWTSSDHSLILKAAGLPGATFKD